MKIIETNIDGAVIVEPKVYGDSRGFFLETWHQERYRQQLKIELPFVQDNHSRSRVRTLYQGSGSRVFPCH